MIRNLSIQLSEVKENSWAVVYLGMQLREILKVSPANITDETIDEALIAKNVVINWNIQQA